MKENVTAEMIREHLSYSPDSGDFVWVKPLARRVKKNSIAGSIDSTGYRRIKIFGKTYRGHRLAWFLFYNKWPTVEVDHIDGNRQNNAIKNLRLATTAQNCQNQPIRKTNTSGKHGVCWKKASKKWVARIGLNGKRIHLGCFSKLEDAGNAYLEAKKELHLFSGRPRDL